MKRFKDIIISNNIQSLLSEDGIASKRAYMLQCTNGKLEMEYGEQNLCMRKNDLLFSPAARIPCNVAISNNFSCTIFALEAQSVSDILYACLREETGWVKKLHYVLRNPIIHLSNRQVGLIRSYRNLTHYYSEEIGHYHRKVAYLQGQSIIYELLSWVDEAMKQVQIKNDETKDSSRTNQLYTDFQKLLNETHATERRVQWYANQLKISSQYLNFICKQMVKVSPQKLIQEVLLKECKLLLTTTSDSIKQITFKLGFSTEGSFCKFFRKEVGVTPSEFRRVKIQ